MRSVSGLDRPAVQWLFLALAVILMAIVGIEGIALRRARQQIDALRAADLNARIERQQIELRALQERSARESMAIQMERLRASGASVAPQPTLTLTPLQTRDATPPEASIDTPPASDTIELRLLLPRAAPATARRFAIVLRDWSNGAMIWSRGGLDRSMADGKPAVIARMTADVLAAGAYEVLLTATGADNQPIEVASYEMAVRPAK